LKASNRQHFQTWKSAITHLNAISGQERSDKNTTPIHPYDAEHITLLLIVGVCHTSLRTESSPINKPAPSRRAVELRATFSVCGWSTSRKPRATSPRNRAMTSATASALGPRHRPDREEQEGCLAFFLFCHSSFDLGVEGQKFAERKVGRSVCVGSFPLRDGSIWIRC